MKQILLDVKRIKDLGVRKVLVALSPPQKCLPLLVTPKGCDTNDTSTYLHNSLLRKGLTKLNDETVNNNDRSFLIFDLYNAFVTIFKNKGVPGTFVFLYFATRNIIKIYPNTSHNYDPRFLIKTY